MARVLGLGGVFLKCRDETATKAWYQRVLGMEPTEFGGFSFRQAESAAAFGDAAMTIFAPFSRRQRLFRAVRTAFHAQPDGG